MIPDLNTFLADRGFATEPRLVHETQRPAQPRPTGKPMLRTTVRFLMDGSTRETCRVVWPEDSARD